MASTNKKIYFAIFGVIALCLLSIGLLIGNSEQKQLSSEKQVPIIQTSTSSTDLQTFDSTSILSNQSEHSNILQNVRMLPAEEKISISFKAGNDTYQISVPQGSSIYDAMTYLSASGTPPLIFEAENYPSLGYFIKSINEKENAGGYYWTLYVNGKYLNIGASAYKLSPGDQVLWKYENL